MGGPARRRLDDGHASPRAPPLGRRGPLPSTLFVPIHKWASRRWLISGLHSGRSGIILKKAFSGHTTFGRGSCRPRRCDPFSRPPYRTHAAISRSRLTPNCWRRSPPPGTRRHSPNWSPSMGRLVRGTARRMAQDPDVAEDVFQATFLLLSRKAAAVSWGPTVGPWLYRPSSGLRPRPGPACPPAPRPDGGRRRRPSGRSVRRARLGRGPGRPRPSPRRPSGSPPGPARAVLPGRTHPGRGRRRPRLLIDRDRPGGAERRLRRLLAHRGLSLSAALAGTLVADSAVAADGAAATARAASPSRCRGRRPRQSGNYWAGHWPDGN